MADKKISQLTALAAANVASATDVLAIVDTSATETKKITAKDLIDGALNGGTANGVLYLNGSKVATSGATFAFDSSDRLIVGAGSAVFGARIECVANTSGDGLRIRGRASDATGILSFGANAAATEYARIQSDNTSVLIFGIGASGTEGMRLTSTGLGIGTTSPAYKLDVTGTSTTALSAAGFTNNSSANNTTKTIGVALRLSDTVGFVKEAAFVTAYPDQANVVGAGLSFATRTADATPNEKMRLDSSGNLGIGTASPGVRLDVIGTQNVSGAASGTATGTLVVKGAQSNASGLVLTQNNSTDTASITNYYNSPLIFGTNNTERGRFTAGGDLLVGTTSTYSAYAKLHVLNGLVTATNATDGGVYIGATTGGTEIGYLSIGRSYNLAASGDTVLSTSAAKPLIFGTNNTERARITSGGAFCVGSTDYATAIVLAKSTAAGTSVYNSWNSATSGTRFHFEFRDDTGATSRGSITTDGANTAYNTSSDRRLKQNIVPCADAGVVIDGIEVVEFDWKSGSHTRFGMIAQNLHLVAPEAVKTGDDGEEVSDAWGVDYSKLVPMLVKEVQSLRKRVAALEAK